ncbi:unnamed protein product [Lathyrus sativus]|nr:unnamed protein product [Lathyrus sativus]
MNLGDVAKLNTADKEMLDAEFIKEYVFETICECDSNKCPRVDGYNFKLLKNYWKIVGFDVTNIVLEFFDTASMSRQVVKEIIAIQRQFLWFGSLGKRGIAWVSWNYLCKDNKCDGLGIKHVGQFNVSLLSKWLWKFLQEGNELWRNILEFRYGNLAKRFLSDDVNGNDVFDSLWMCDLISVCDVDNGSCFKNMLSVILGNVNLCLLFPSLFEFSTTKLWSVNEMRELENLLISVQPNIDIVDRWLWQLENNKHYPVKSYYDHINDAGNYSMLDPPVLTALEILWKTCIPLKIKIFVWRIFLNRLSTRKNLVDRGIIVIRHEKVCVLCFNDLEDISRPFSFVLN